MAKKIGNYALIIGVMTAIVVGLADEALGAVLGSWLVSLTVVLGLVVGFLNVGGRETKDFLMVAAALAIISYATPSVPLRQVEVIGKYLQNTFQQIMLIVVPAAIVVALKYLYATADSK